MKFNKWYEFVEGKIGGAFAKYGRLVSRHAWKIIIVTIIVNGALGIGMINLQSDIETGNVYLPQGTEARDDLAKVDDIFPNLSGLNFNPLTVSLVEGLYARVIIRSTSGNLLDRTVIEEVKAMSEFIQTIESKDDSGKTIKFTDICARSHSRCALEGDTILDDDFLAAVDNNNVTYPVFVSSSTGSRDYSGVVGNVKLDGTGKILTGMEFLRIGFNMRTDAVVYKTKAAIWAAEFLVRMRSYPGSANFDFAYGHYDSLDEELDKNVSGDITLFAATIALMITYACVATLSYRLTDQVGQRMWLGFGGILAAGLAIVSSFGLCAACGVDFVSIVGIVPFLIIGIGIDDMFILLSGLSEAQTKHSVEDKLAETLRISGVGITITSITDLIAFMAGAGSSFIAVRNFCIYTGVAVVFCYINNVTLFASCIAINERRVEENRHFMTCRRIQTKEVLKIENRSKTYIMCCGGRAPRNREEAESFVDKFPRWLFPKIVLKLPCKIIIIIIFIGYLAAAIYGCVNLKQGLLFTQLVSDDSYFFKYTDWEEKYFKRNYAVSFVFPTTHAYSEQETQVMIDELMSTVQSNKYFENGSEVNWLKTYMNSEYLNLSSSESSFIYGLKRFLSDQRYSVFESDVVIDSNDNHITSSRVYVFTVDLEDSQEEGKMMQESRDLARAATINCFALSPAFVAFEQYVRILDQTLFSVGIALVAVFIITCIFMPHPILIIFVTIIVTMIMIGVFGFIYYLDVALSAITMIHMIMSIGFSVDFTAHICHGYMISNGESRDIRVKQAIDKTGAPIFHGAVSSLLGILVLVAAKSYIFRTFAAVMSLVLLFGIAHALLLLPVILSWIGPGRLNSDASKGLHSDESTQNKQDEYFETDGTFVTIVSNRKVRQSGFGEQTQFPSSRKRTNQVVFNETNPVHNDTESHSDYNYYQMGDLQQNVQDNVSNEPDSRHNIVSDIDESGDSVTLPNKDSDHQDKHGDNMDVNTNDTKDDNDAYDDTDTNAIVKQNNVIQDTGNNKNFAKEFKDTDAQSKQDDVIQETEDSGNSANSHTDTDEEQKENNDQHHTENDDVIKFKQFALMYNLNINDFNGTYSWQKAST